MKILDSEIQRFFNTKNWKIALRYHDQDVVDEIVIKESIPGFLYEINADVYKRQMRHWYHPPMYLQHYAF